MLFELQKLVSDLSLVERNHYRLNSDRRENDIEHSFTVALLCWHIHSKLKLQLSLEKILKYAMIHDFAERYAGDVNTFASAADRESKVVREAAAVKRLSREFTKFDDLVTTLQDYENKIDEEAEFVWAVDKMQALILGDLDNWRPYREINIDFATFCNKHGEQVLKSSPYCQEIYKDLLEYCKTTYYDRPE